MEASPVISIVTALYRSTPCIGRLHASLAAQTFRDFEWVCVDDASPDDTVGFVRRLSDPGGSPTQLFQLPDNSGGTTALALGIEKAQGAIILCIDHDDELLPDSLQRVIDGWPEVAADDTLAGLQFRTRDSRSGELYGETMPDGLRFGTRWQENRHPEFCDATPAIKAEVLKEHACLEKFEPIALWGVIHNAITTDRDWKLASGSEVRIYHRDMQNSQTAFIRISRKTVHTYAVLLDQWDSSYFWALPRWFRHAVSLLRFSHAVHGSEFACLKLIKNRWIRFLIVPLAPIARVLSWIKPPLTIVDYVQPDFRKLRALPNLKAVSL
jgi:glycosyltransferase involved in cell wall biosynthesis